MIIIFFFVTTPAREKLSMKKTHIAYGGWKHCIKPTACMRWLEISELW